MALRLPTRPCSPFSLARARPKPPPSHPHTHTPHTCLHLHTHSPPYACLLLVFTEAEFFLGSQLSPSGPTTGCAMPSADRGPFELLLARPSPVPPYMLIQVPPAFLLRPAWVPPPPHPLPSPWGAYMTPFPLLPPLPSGAAFIPDPTPPHPTTTHSRPASPWCRCLCHLLCAAPPFVLTGADQGEGGLPAHSEILWHLLFVPPRTFAEALTPPTPPSSLVLSPDTPSGALFPAAFRRHVSCTVASCQQAQQPLRHRCAQPQANPGGPSLLASY